MGCDPMNSREFHTVRGYEILEKQKDMMSHSMEDYMEMIYRIWASDGYVRINALAEALNVKASSATKMVQKLGRLGLLRYEKYGMIRLTKEGEKTGKFLLDRHNTIERFLRNIGVEQNLLVNVELIEHNVTGNALSKIELLNRFLDENPEIMEKYGIFKQTCEKDTAK